MKNPARVITKYFAQYFIASILLFSSIGKLLDIQGLATVIESYKVFSGWIAAPLGLALSLTEFGLAIWLFSGKKLKLAAVAAIILHAIFIVWISIAMARGLKIPNCGCFGAFWARPLDIITLLEDFLMLAISILLYYEVKYLNENSR